MPWRWQQRPRSPLLAPPACASAVSAPRAEAAGGWGTFRGCFCLLRGQGCRGSLACRGAVETALTRPRGDKVGMAVSAGGHPRECSPHCLSGSWPRIIRPAFGWGWWKNPREKQGDFCGEGTELHPAPPSHGSCGRGGLAARGSEHPWLPATAPWGQLRAPHPSCSQLQPFPQEFAGGFVLEKPGET